MENTQRKKPAEWFQMLKEPYRSEAIKNIDEGFLNYQLYPTSLENALFFSFSWRNVAQDYEYWHMITKSIKSGETTYLEPELIGNTDKLKPIKFENVSLINEVNNSQVTEQQNQIQPEKTEPDYKAKFEELQKRYEVLVTEANKLDVLSGEMCDKYTALKASYERLSIYNDELTEKINETETKNNQEKVYIHYNSKHEKWLQADTLELALEQSEENKNIYEAVKIGVKKSILVNE